MTPPLASLLASPLSGAVVVTGTGTEVGKTVVTAALAAVQRAAGRRVALVKPTQTGLTPGLPGDVHEAGRLAGVEDLLEGVRLPDPLAPDAAARLAGLPLPPLSAHAQAVQAYAVTHDLVLVEGAGGLLVRLDEDGGTLADLARTLAAPALLVAAAGLGALNQAALTLEALAARGVPLLGVVVGRWPERPGLAERQNLADLVAYARAPLLGVLPDGAGRLDPATFARRAPQWLAVSLGGTARGGPAEGWGIPSLG
ncbi:MAG: dethiobiotin synthase [Actinomycetes bacterium]